MSEKVAVITGASGGLAQEVITGLLNAGYSIAALNRNNDFNFHSFKAQSESLNLNFRNYICDLASEESITNASLQILNDYKRIDAIIHLAGVSFSGMSWKQSKENWNEVLNINLTGPMLLSKQFIPEMKKQNEGTIIYFSSIVAHRPVAGTSAYAASKSALEGLTRAQAVELGSSNIRVNCIAPGYFEAGMIREINDEMRKELIQSTPLKSLGNPKAIAETVLYLCGAGGQFTTGQTLHINGGLFI